MLADHPFLPKTSRLVLADYVTMDSGTGCVHTAPGFGADDYQTCKRYGHGHGGACGRPGPPHRLRRQVRRAEDRGVQPHHPGGYEGRAARCLPAEDIVHSYPHCWRCKNPIIFRATPQWFCSVETFKDEACAACDQVRWVPAWGQDRMKAMVRERADWCISRQRRWGLPIPVFYCNDCGKPIATDETIGDHLRPLCRSEGSNAWFAKDAAEILPDGFTCPHCGKASGFTKEDGHPGRLVRLRLHPLGLHEERTRGFWPADVYLEGAGPVPRLVPVRLC